MSVQGFSDLKNQMNIAAWRWRWALQGGGTTWTARPLQDLRNDEDLRRYRCIEFKRRRLGKKARKVISLAAWRINRARRHG